MARHNGSQRRGKRKKFKGRDQSFDGGGDSIIIDGRRFYTHQMNEAGHAFERLVEQALIMLEATGSIITFVRHPSNSPEDKAGKDFTITVYAGPGRREIPFGVSISKHRAVKSRQRHPKVQIFVMRHYWNVRQIAHFFIKEFELQQAA